MTEAKRVRLSTNTRALDSDYRIFPNSHLPVISQSITQPLISKNFLERHPKENAWCGFRRILWRGVWTYLHALRPPVISTAGGQYQASETARHC